MIATHLDDGTRGDAMNRPGTAILNYYHETATEIDYLVAGPSGVGYFYPVAWPLDQLQEFLKKSASYLEMFAAIGLLAWNLTPTDALILVRSLGPEFEVVLADEFFALLRQAMNLPAYEEQSPAP